MARVHRRTMLCPACHRQTIENPCSTCRHKTDKTVGDRECDCNHCKAKRRIGPIPVLVRAGQGNDAPCDAATFCFNGEGGPGSAQLGVG